MANEYYISAGISVEKDGDTPTANTFYISAGIPPVVEEGPGDTILPIIMNYNQKMRS